MNDMWIMIDLAQNTCKIKNANPDLIVSLKTQEIRF